MKKFLFIWLKLSILCLSTSNFSIASAQKSDSKPNVVLIVCDDLNDYITGVPYSNGHPQAITPHTDRLAASAVAFRRAYSNNPVCAPSRASFLTGLYGHHTDGNVWPKWYAMPGFKNNKTLMQHFRENGYQVVGSGKLMHFLKKDEWTHFQNEADYGPFAFNGEKNTTHTNVPQPFASIGPVDGSYGALETLDYITDGNPQTGWVAKQPWAWKELKKQKYLNFSNEGDRSLTADETNAKWAAQKILEFSRDGSEAPFFLGVGFIRPHTPLHVSQKYYDMYPLDTIQLPEIKPNDNTDTYLKNYIDDPNKEKGHRYFKKLVESYDGDTELALKTFTQAYMACVTAVDECIGTVIDAVDNSPMRDNTIIVLVSDHGWQMGEKDFLFKASPWEESTRIPFIVRAPGTTKPGGVAEHPVSLIDLYPTLVDLCQLSGDNRKNAHGHKLDGFSLRPFLENPIATTWDGPTGALSTLQGKHWTLRTTDWRYIRYENGEEELYNHNRDPHEWVNLASNPELAEIKQELHTQLLQMSGLPQ